MNIITSELWKRHPNFMIQNIKLSGLSTVVIDFATIVQNGNQCISI